MRTGIFVYAPTSLKIHTCESNLELAYMQGQPVPLASGQSVQPVDPGIYMIVSDYSVDVAGDSEACDIVVAPENKTSGPPPPLRVSTASFGPVNSEALDEFFTVPAAKGTVNP